MNRLGFVLLTVGTTVASLGAIFHHQVITLIGLAPIVFLCALAALVPSSIAYDVSSASRPKSSLENRLWGAYFVSAMCIVGLGVLHVGVKQPDEPPAGLLIMAVGIVLLCTIYAYQFVDEERVRTWQSKVRRRP